jgi:formylglycine-generating enzyme required for sulfatase activity
VVSDGTDSSTPDQVVITVKEPPQNLPPTADAGLDQQVDIGAVVTLDGTGSSDPDGTIASYAWSSLDAVTLSDSTAVMPTFTAGTTPGLTYTFELVVSDGTDSSTPDQVIITVQAPPQNLPPTADAGADQFVPPTALVTLDGSGSSDPEGTIASYTWSSLDAVTLSDSTAVMPTFTAGTTPGLTYTFELVVSDGTDSSAPDTVVVTTGREPADLEVTLPDGRPMGLQWIGPGTFTMGQASAGITPQHLVTLTHGFYMGQFEVTQAQWQAVMGTTPWVDQSYAVSDPNAPATHVIWEDATAFVHQLNVAAGDSLYRLPTEAEWEYACRAGSSALWTFGDDQNQLAPYAWYGMYDSYSAAYHVQPVGTRRPNAWGLYDMHGNAAEWVYDRFGAYQSGQEFDPVGPAGGYQGRVVRGGRFDDYASSTYSASRSSSYYSSYDIGFRVVRMAAPPPLAWSAGMTVQEYMGMPNRVDLRFGVAWQGSNGIDNWLGENELPPAPPTGTFDGRFLSMPELPMDPQLALDKDYRGMASVANGAVWQLAVQTGFMPHAYLQWDKSELPDKGSFRLVSVSPGDTLIDIDMRQQGYCMVMPSNGGRVLLEIRYTLVPTATHTYELPARWNMVSLPVAVADPSYTTIFPGARSLFGFDGTYQDESAFQPATGYWLNLSEPAAVSVTGTAFADTQLVRSLPSHWSLIGPGTQSLDVQGLKAYFPSIISVYQYSGGYSQASVLEPGRAYWVNLSEPTVVDLSGRVAAVNPNPNPPSKLAVDVAAAVDGPVLWAEGSRGQQAIRLGVNLVEVTELPPVPPSELFDARVELGQGLASLQVPVGEGQYRVRLQGGVERLRWQSVPAGRWELQVGGRTMALAGDGQVTVPTGTEVLLRQRAAVPSTTALLPSYPNPFNPTTTLRYELSKAGAVQVRIYAATGQLVRTLVSGHQEAGSYSQVWDGRDAAGLAVGNGVYLCELQAGDFRGVQRLLLMK